MRPLVYLPLLVPVLAAPLARPLAAKADPRRATWMLTGAAILLAVACSAALGLLIAAAAIRTPQVARLGHWSMTVLGHDTPTRIATALAALLALGTTTLAAVRFGVRRTRAIAAAYRYARRLPGHPSTIVVADDQAADAYTVPGFPGRIVVSTGMLLALGAEGRAVLLAHERAHLTGRHYLFTSLSHMAASLNPLLRPYAQAVEYTVERWADERAATEVGDRRLVAETIARAALATKITRPRRPVTGALGIAMGQHERQLSAAGPVPRRVAALLDAPQPAHSRIMRVALTLLVLVALCCALWAAWDLQHLQELADVGTRR